MGPFKVAALLVLAIAIPATAHTFDFSVRAPGPACLAIGNAWYRAVPASGRADVTVRIDPAATAPDIRIQIVDRPDAADFVFVDDGAAAPACPHGGAAPRTVKIDAAAPDLVATITTDAQAADYRLFVQSRWISREIAAALFAAARASSRTFARRADRSN